MAGRIMLDNVRGKWTTLPTTTVDLRGRIIVITGSNTGLGLETAKMMYKMNPARLILAVRSLEKGEAAKQEILKLKTSDTKVDVWKLDMSDFDSVKLFANKCDAELERLDVFLANAGTMGGPWQTTKDGWESQLQVNVIATYLLCALVLPLLSKTAKLPPPVAGVSLKPHLSIVSSALHGLAKFPERNASNTFQALNTQAQFNEGDRYNVTKMLVLLLTQQLAKSSAVGPGVIVNSVNPNFCRSELMRNQPKIVQVIAFGLMARTTEEGAKTFLWACLSNDMASGSYTSSCRVEKPLSFAATAEGTQVQKKAWNELGQIISKIAPETNAVWST